jgi:glycosyltransferase involved in cell wall biosynthesis
MNFKKKMDISVIIPTLNEEKSIELCLKSICSQNTNLAYEVIVSDCKSEDKTLEIAEKYADKIVFSEHKSIGITRNTGAKVSKGRYLVFIDADTVIPKNYLEKVAEKFSDSSLLGFSAGFIFSKRNPQLILIEKFTNSYLAFRDKVRLTTLLGFNICVRKNAFTLINGFRDVPLEDGDFSIRLRRKGKVKYFTDFFVITSSRRLEEMGLLGTLRYYFEMDLAMRSSLLKEFLTYNQYMPLRINGNSLEKEFLRIYELSPHYLGGVDLTLRDYIQTKSSELFNAMKTNSLGKIPKRKILDKITKTSKSIAELKLTQKITKKDIDRAIRLIKERGK